MDLTSDVLIYTCILEGSLLAIATLVYLFNKVREFNND